MTMYEFVSLDKSPSFYRQKDKKKGGDVSGSRINTESENKILFLQTQKVDKTRVHNKVLKYKFINITKYR